MCASRQWHKFALSTQLTFSLETFITGQGRILFFFCPCKCHLYLWRILIRPYIRDWNPRYNQYAIAVYSSFLHFQSLLSSLSSSSSSSSSKALISAASWSVELWLVKKAAPITIRLVAWRDMLSLGRGSGNLLTLCLKRCPTGGQYRGA